MAKKITQTEAVKVILFCDKGGWVLKQDEKVPHFVFTRHAVKGSKCIVPSDRSLLHSLLYVTAAIQASAEY